MLISIIMPVYNNEKYFPLAVNSILEQDYDCWELIIIDDGSTDDTSLIADEIAKKDSRIKVIHQNNQWIYASFNKGIENANGDYIYILNSDDRMRPGCLAKMAENVKKYNTDIIWTKVLVHECDVEQNITSYNVGKLDELVREDMFCPSVDMVRLNWPYFLFSALAQNQANLYRAEIMKKNKYRTDVYGADTLFNIAIAPSITSAFVMKDPVYDFFIYRHDGMNASMGKYYPYEHDMLNEIYSGYMKLFSGWGLLPENYQKTLIDRRVKQVTGEIYSLFCKNCNMSTEEKLRHILCKIPDSVMMECVELGKKREEFESRILSGIRELFIREPIEKDSKMYFVFELLESLLRYEKDEDDYRQMREAVCNPHNPARIGQVFYDKLRNEIRHGRENGNDNF